MESEKLKILFLSSWYPVPTNPMHGIFVKHHAELLVPHSDVSVVYICSGENKKLEVNTINGVYTAVSYFKKVKIQLPVLSAIIKLFRYHAAWKEALTVYNNQKGLPDIIQANVVYPVALVARRLSRKWKVPFVIMEHWSGYFPQDGRYKGERLVWATRLAIKSASAVATVSEALKQKMLSFNLKNKYYVIPNAVNTDLFTIPSTAKQDKNLFNLIHVSIGEDERKNVKGIIRAFSKFHQRYLNSKLTLVLEPCEKTEELKLLAKSLELDEPVCFLTPVLQTDLVKLFQQSDAFVLFSDVETQGIVVLEALCCGIPAISSRCGEPEEYINRKNGLLVDAFDEKQLADAMETMFKNKADYNPEIIRNSVIAMVSHEAVAKKFMEMYKDVLNIK